METNSRQKQKERTRERLVQAAYEVFSRQGILKSRMEDVALEAGVSHGTVFLHFGSQEELTEAVVWCYGRQIAARTHELTEEAGSLESVLEAHLQGIAAYEPFYVRLLTEARLLPQGVRDTFVGIQSILSLHFSRALKREGFHEGLGIDAGLMFNLWIGLVHHYLQNGDLFAPGSGVIARHGAALKAAYLTLVKNQGMPDTCQKI